jgi:glycosyltransferase involved in cell wall biosynthesis
MPAIDRPPAPAANPTADPATHPAATPVGRSDTVSVIVPCRNERAHIEPFCAAVLRQQLPPGWALQLVIADGQSDDGTRETLQRLAAAEPRIGWIDNPQRIVSSGLNRALARSIGEVVVRMDVHTDYADDYIAQGLAALAASGADNVGGPWHARPGPAAGALQRAAAAAFQSRWVAGGARSRDLAFSGWVDTVYLGCWPRASFERFGGFDEQLVRNQDDEHNLRIRQGGGRVWQSASMRSFYRPRATWAQLFRQYLQYGYWKPFVMKKHGQPASLRHLAPAALVAALAAATLAALAGAPAWPLAGLCIAYAGAVAAMTVGVAAASVPPRRFDLAAWAWVPAVILAYHLGYGIGTLIGGWDVLRHGAGRERFAALTR